MFALKPKKERHRDAADLMPHYLLAFHGDWPADTDTQAQLDGAMPGEKRCVVKRADAVNARDVAKSEFVLALFTAPDALDRIADAVLDARASGRPTTLIVATRPAQLTALGQWLHKRAEAGRLAGTRLMVADSVADAARQLESRLVAVTEDNVIRMPMNTEVDNSPIRNFYTFSPEVQALVRRIRGFADNGITRAYLLGGPGSGKTSLAYYYFLRRSLGRFVSVNLMAENTGDKAAVKSLLCGHVPGAFPGAGNRAGAFDLAQDGVCFVDESHGVTGAVMETLMEALDGGQYLPLGAAAKRPLRCALLFATNRSWEHLQDSVNLDEFTRLGAAVLQLTELSQREEDMIAVTATTLAKLAAPCTTWQPPAGLEREAWTRIRNCRWHGNVRGLIRTLEAAFVETAGDRGDALMRDDAVERGIALWEPAEHHSHAIYAANM